MRSIIGQLVKLLFLFGLFAIGSAQAAPTACQKLQGEWKGSLVFSSSNSSQNKNLQMNLSLKPSGYKSYSISGIVTLGANKKLPVLGSCLAYGKLSGEIEHVTFNILKVGQFSVVLNSITDPTVMTEIVNTNGTIKGTAEIQNN